MYLIDSFTLEQFKAIDYNLSAKLHHISEAGPPLLCDGDSGVCSDHCIIKTFNPQTDDEPTAVTINMVYDLRKSNVEKFIDELLRSGFASVYADVDASNKCDYFYSVLRTAMGVLPTKTVIMTPRDKPWITPIIKCMINDR